MPYWTSETLRRRIPDAGLVIPYNETCVKHCAYELAMGPEAFITSSDGRKKVVLDEGEPIVIPSGQFALLLTEEEVKIPLEAIGFISMRFGIKRKGLINVSGFHVDPGFEGRLKFSVYNAGSREITVSRGDRIFVLWFAALDSHTEDAYRSNKDEQWVITSNDQNLMHGDVASPAELKKELDEVRHMYINHKWLLTTLVGVVVAIFLRLLFMTYFAETTPLDIDRLKADIREQVVSELNASTGVGVNPKAGATVKKPTTLP